MDDSVIEQYHKQKIEQELKDMAKGIKQSIEEGLHDHDHGKVVKTVPMTKEWLAMYDDLEASVPPLVALMKDVKSRMNKMKIKRDFMWGTIATQLDEWRDMHLDRETKDVHIYEGDGNKEEK